MSLSPYLKYLGVLLFILIWWIVKLLFFGDSIFLSSPTETFYRLGELILSGEVLPDVVGTISKFGKGYLIAVLIGLPIGIILGMFEKLFNTMEILIDFFRSIPVTTLFPLFILYFGIGNATIVAMVAVACLFVVILNAAYGALYSNRIYKKVMITFGGNWYQTFKEAILPASLPFIFIGLRVSVSFGLIVEIVAEMFIGAENGLGNRVYEAHETYLIADVYALTLLIGILGYALNKVFLISEKKIIHWRSISS